MSVQILPPPAIEFVVFGEPGVAGNKSVGVTKSGRRFVREGHSRGAVENAKRWRDRVHEVVQDMARSGAPMLEGPLVAAIVFYRAKPASAPKTRRSWPDTRPDTSKYLRAIEDPMKGILIRDDSQIVEFCELRKAYPEDVTPDDPRPRCEVRLWRYEDYYRLAPEQHNFRPDFPETQRCALCWQKEPGHYVSKPVAIGGPA